MTTRRAKAEAVTRQIRACFNRLKALADALHADLGVTGAMRAVIESLDEGGEQTVPTIARAKSVTRQHIQVLVNALLEAGLVSTRDNPADKRSPLVALTPKGRAAFATMREREKSVLADLTTALAGQDLDAALATLEALRAHLDRRLSETRGPG